MQQASNIKKPASHFERRVWALAAGFEAAAGRGAAESTPGRIQNRYGVFKSECNGILLKERGADASRLGGKLRDVVARNAVVAHLQVGYAAGDLKVMEGAQEVIRMNGILDAECMSELDKAHRVGSGLDHVTEIGDRQHNEAGAVLHFGAFA